MCVIKDPYSAQVCSINGLAEKWLLSSPKSEELMLCVRAVQALVIFFLLWQKVICLILHSEMCTFAYLCAFYFLITSLLPTWQSARDTLSTIVFVFLQIALILVHFFRHYGL